MRGKLVDERKIGRKEEDKYLHKGEIKGDERKILKLRRWRRESE